MSSDPIYQWSQIRASRNQLLKDSDWIVLVTDSTITSDQKTAIIAYRQLLRDLPTTQTDPSLIVFPTKPSIIKA